MYNNCYSLARVWAACGPKDDNIQSRYFAILKAAYFAENFAVFARNFPYFLFVIQVYVFTYILA